MNELSQKSQRVKEHKIGCKYHHTWSLLWVWISTIKIAMIAYAIAWCLGRSGGISSMQRRRYMLYVYVLCDVNFPGLYILPIAPTIPAIQPGAMFVRLRAHGYLHGTAQWWTWHKNARRYCTLHVPTWECTHELNITVVFINAINTGMYRKSIKQH